MKLVDYTDAYFVLDFDRCIGNTDKVHEVLWRVMEIETGIPATELRMAKYAMDAEGYSFDTVEFVAKELLRRASSKTWQHIRQLYVAAAKAEDLLEPDAARLLDMLDERRIPYGILTYGTEAWQLTKLEAAGLVDRGVPFEITQIEHKGEVLSGWKRDVGFAVPPAMTRTFKPLSVRSIVFLDDKPRSFVALPEGVHGICVRPVAYPPRGSQQGPLPAGVDEAEGIREAIQLLQL